MTQYPLYKIYNSFEMLLCLTKTQYLPYFLMTQDLNKLKIFV